MRRLALSLTLILGTSSAGAALDASRAHAEPSMHLAWDDCGASGSAMKQFSCDANSGVDRLVLSFVPPEGMTDINGIEATVRVFTADGTLSPWWSLATGGCRAGSVSGIGDLTSLLGTCAHPFAGLGAGGAFASTLNVGQIKLAAAGPNPVALDPSVEYYAGMIVFNHAHTIGTGACGGCSQPMGIYFESLRLDHADATTTDLPSYRSTGVLPSVNWQCTGSPRLYDDFRYGWFLEGWDFPGCPTATKRPTWGAVKGLYR